jgi:hypothetical protein
MAKVTRKQFEDFFWDQVEKDVLPDPDTYTLEELNYLNPEVPSSFNAAHVARREARKNGQKVRS